jgi:hypothetical protein
MNDVTPSSSKQAGWIDDKLQIEYRFTYFSDVETTEIVFLGGIEKWWLNEEIPITSKER